MGIGLEMLLGCVAPPVNKLDAVKMPITETRSNWSKLLEKRKLSNEITDNQKLKCVQNSTTCSNKSPIPSPSLKQLHQTLYKEMNIQRQLSPS